MLHSLVRRYAVCSRSRDWRILALTLSSDQKGLDKRLIPLQTCSSRFAFQPSFLYALTFSLYPSSISDLKAL